MCRLSTKLSTRVYVRVDCPQRCSVANLCSLYGIANDVYRLVSMTKAVKGITNPTW